MIDDTRRLMLSVRPRFAAAILAGDKTVELRRTRPALTLPTESLLYASSPKRSLVGRCNVVDVIAHTPVGLWRKHGKHTAVTWEEFKAYFAGATIAYGLILNEPRPLGSPVTLERIRQAWAGFQPPQSFRYVSVPRSDELLAIAS